MSFDFNSVKWGWDYQNEDRQELARSSVTPVYGDVDLKTAKPLGVREWMRIENQKQLGACAGFSRSTVAELCYWLATKSVIQFSPMFCYITGQMIDGINGDRGSTISGHLKAAKQYGHCLEETMKYTGVYSRNIPQAAYTEGLNFQCLNGSKLTAYKDVAAYIAQGTGAVMMGVIMTRQNGPVIEKWSFDGGGHGMPWVDISERRDRNGNPYLLRPNSWGTTWGDDGWQEDSPYAVEQIINHQYSEVIGLTDMESPMPRKIPRKEVKWA